jgi:peptidoglycan-associated lipoprotein
MKNITILCAILSLILVGCGPKPVHVPITQRAGETGPSKGGTGITDGSDKQPGAGIEEEELLRKERERRRLAEEAEKKALLADILFDFDTYTIKSSYLPVLKNIADWMKQNGTVRLAVEGHADERGTTEYNLALGQKRADTVRDHLVRLGVDPKKLKSASYGKEMPVDPGHTEEAWVKNRRVHFRIE